MKTVSVLVISTIVTIVSGRSSCMKSLTSNSSVLDLCLNKTCILFRDNSMNIEMGAPPRPPAEVPFLCRRRNVMYPSLRGIQLSLLDEIPELDSALCIFAKGCTSNELVQVLERAGKIGKYRFIAADFLFILPTRISLWATPSTPIFGGMMVVVGKSRRPDSNMAVIQAFTAGSWLLAVSLFVTLIGVRIWIVVQLLPVNKNATFQKRWQDRWWCVWGEYQRVVQLGAEASTYSREESLLFWCRKWTQVFTVCLAIFVIFYEIGIVAAIFKKDNAFTVPIKELPEKQLREFVIKVDSAHEHFFRLLADPTGIYDNSKSIPWSTVQNLDDAFLKIRNASHPAKYALAYSHYVQYVLRKQGACEQFAVFPTQDANPTFNACLYYGIGIPESERISINRRLTNLVDSQRVNTILNTVAPKSNCGESIEGPIPAVVLAETILPIGGVFVLFVVITRIRDLIVPSHHSAAHAAQSTSLH